MSAVPGTGLDGPANQRYLRSMIRRLLVLVLTVWLAVPAVAMPHAREAPAPIASHCDDVGKGTPADQPEGPPMVLHGCIGCLPLFATMAVAPATFWFAPAPYRATHRALTPHPRDGPDTPPPRA